MFFILTRCVKLESLKLHSCEKINDGLLSQIDKGLNQSQSKLSEIEITKSGLFSEVQNKLYNNSHNYCNLKKFYTI